MTAPEPIVAPRHSGAICVLARAPSAPGKTRLTQGLSADRAHALRRALLLDTLQCAAETGLSIVVAYTPASAAEELAELVAVPSNEGPGPQSRPRLIPQSDGGLGARMRGAFNEVFALGAGRVVLIGSDLPTLPPAHIVDAMAALDRVQVVIGPAADGGYYLIGMREPHPELFDGIAWGSGHVLGDTYAAARASALPVEAAPVWHDVDVIDDLRRIAASGRARHTRAWLMGS